MILEKRTIIFALLAIIFTSFSAYAADMAGITFKEYNQGLPDYENSSPFKLDSQPLQNELISAINSAKTSANSSKCLKVKLLNWGEMDSLANICNKDDVYKIKASVKKLAPSLNANNMVLYKTDLDLDGKSELLLGYYEFPKGNNYDPYFFNFVISAKDNRIKISVDGPMLVGGMHKIEKFGPDNRNIIFYKMQSCTECEPWIYLSPVDHVAKITNAFKFSYSDEHSGFDSDIEYVLPGMGHSVDAKVETKIPAVEAKGVHLVQKYTMDDGKVEWWQFRCKNYQCDYNIVEQKEVPKDLKKIWNTAKSL